MKGFLQYRYHLMNVVSGIKWHGKSELTVIFAYKTLHKYLKRFNIPQISAQYMFLPSFYIQSYTKFRTKTREDIFTFANTILYKIYCQLEVGFVRFYILFRTLGKQVWFPLLRVSFIKEQIKANESHTKADSGNQ